MSRLKKKDGLVSKVLKFKFDAIKKDDAGRYIPFCDYHWHRGLIKDENVCITRNCTHYCKLYIKKK